MMESSSRQTAKSLGIFFLVVLLVLLLIRVSRQGIYSNQMGMNIMVFGKEKVALLMIRPEEEVVGWVTFPNNLMVKIFNSDARYPVASLWSYGVLEKNPYQIVEKSMGLSMGVVVSRTMKIEVEASVEGVLASLHRWDLKTDLSLRDRFLIRKFLASSVASKKVLEMDIPTKIFDKTIEPDGKELIAFNSVATLWTKNKFVFESILSENVDLTVNNLSGQPGLGTQVARQLESAGMRVVEVKTDPEKSVSGSGCQFKVFGRYPFTESLLTNQMNCLNIDSSGDTIEEKGITVWIK